MSFQSSITNTIAHADNSHLTSFQSVEFAGVPVTGNCSVNTVPALELIPFQLLE